MKKTTLYTTSILIAMLAFSIAVPAFATELGGNGGGRANGDGQGMNLKLKTDAEIQAKANTEIDRRIADLQALQTRIGAMVRLSTGTKTALTSSIASEIAALSALKTKINSETGDALKADTKSITGSYRVYMVVMPQARILAAADKAQTVAESLTTLSGKLQVRITAYQASGKDATALTASLADMNAKIADAKIQAQAAIDLVATLSPDQKDKTKMAANQQALAAARLKLKTVESDLKAAHEDSKSIIKVLKGDKKESKKDKDDNN